MPENKDISIIRSDEMQEILFSPPHSLLRVGSSIIGIVIFVLLLGCVFFKYPDVITCNVTITKENPPVWVVARSSGRIQELYVSDNQGVEVGEIIAVIENPAITHDVLVLDSMLAELICNNENCVRLQLDETHLGSIQSTYGTLVRAITDYNNFVGHNLYDQRIAAEEARLKPYIEYLESMKKIAGYGSRISNINEVNYQREKNLYEKGLISKSDIESVEQALLSSNMSEEQMRSSIANAKIQITQIRNNISELMLQREQDKRQTETALHSALENTRNAIQEWKQAYIIQSPVNGILSYSNIWQKNQNVSAGENVFSIINEKEETIIGKVKIPIVGSGKVKVGQRVNIRLDGFPYLEYGFLNGHIVSVAPMPDEGSYTATMRLDDNGITSYKKSIIKDGDLTGIAEIITDDQSVAERLISPLRYFFHWLSKN